MHAPADGRLVAALLEGDTPFGAVAVARDAPFSPTDAQLVEASANQLALALRKADLIERLTAENLVRDLFDALEEGIAPAAASRARAAGWDATRPHVIIVAAPAGGGAVALGPRARRDRRAAPAPERDARAHRPRAGAAARAGPARAATTPRGSLERLTDELRAIGEELGVAFGISEPDHAIGEDATSLGEATDAMDICQALHPARRRATVRRPGRLPLPGRLRADRSRPTRCMPARSPRWRPMTRKRQTDLTGTLERFLAQRGGVRSTARDLVIHPNTLRQRLQRIEELTELRLDGEDLLSLELALKVHRLRSAPTRRGANYGPLSHCPRAGRHVRMGPMAETIVRTTCPRDCYDACGIEVLVRDGHVRVRGDREHPVSRGRLCRKCTLAYNGVFLDPAARVTQPLRRVGPKGAARSSRSAGRRR